MAQFDSKAVKELRANLMPVFEEFKKKHKIEITFGTMRYDDTTCRFTCDARIASSFSTGMSAAAQDFVRAANAKQLQSLNGKMRHLKASDLNRTFMFRSRTYKIVGFKPRKQKYSIMVHRDDEKGLCMSIEQVADALYGE